MLRSLAELAAEKARISSRIAQLNARKGVVTTLTPLAEQNVTQTEGFLNALQKAGANGLTDRDAKVKGEDGGEQNATADAGESTQQACDEP